PFLQLDVDLIFDHPLPVACQELIQVAELVGSSVVGPSQPVFLLEIDRKSDRLLAGLVVLHPGEMLLAVRFLQIPDRLQTKCVPLRDLAVRFDLFDQLTLLPSFQARNEGEPLRRVNPPNSPCSVLELRVEFAHFCPTLSSRSRGKSKATNRPGSLL